MKLVPDVYEKQAWEERDCAIEWKKALGTATISSIMSVTSKNRETGVDSTTSIVKQFSIVTTKTLIRLMGGLSGEVHDVHIKIVLSDGQKVEGDLALIVID